MSDHDEHHHHRVFGELTPLEEATSIALQAVRPIQRVERVTLTEAVGRVLAEDIVSPVDVPDFPKAMMDGFAVRSQDIGDGHTTLRVVGKAHPGEPFSGRVHAGESVKTATGAQVPPGSDLVIEVEEVSLDGSEVEVPGGLVTGRNVQPVGQDIAEGDSILSRGALLQPGHVGSIASLGILDVPVYERPRVAVLATGREIKRGGPLQPGEIFDVNSFTLTGLIQEHGGSVEMFDPIPDTYASILGAVAKAEDYDLMVLSGSTSVGERDFLRDAAAEHGEVLLHGVAMKPGKPVLLAKVGKGLVFGMPGFPASALMAAYHFLLPVLRKMGQLPEAPRRPSILGEDLPVKGDATQLVTVRREGGKAYQAFRGSGSITSISQGDGYVVIPPGEALKKGTPVEVIEF